VPSHAIRSNSHIALSMRFRLRDWAAGLTAVSATIAMAAIGVIGSAPAAGATTPAAPLQCDGSVVYAQDANGNVYPFDVVTHAAGAAVLTGQQNNGLGLSNDGSVIYTLNNGTGGATKRLGVYQVGTGDISPSQLGDSGAPATIIRGAVNPANGLYYYADSGSPVVYLGAYNPATGTAFKVGTIAGMSGSNGDFAFTSSGQLIVVADSNIYKVNEPIPATAGNVAFTTSLITTMPGGVMGNGISFGNNGHIFVTAATPSKSITEVDPATGTLYGTYPISFSPTDMASCAYPNSVTLRAAIDPGRVNSTDQFTLTIGGPAFLNGVAAATATTVGTSIGVQSRFAGPVFVGGGLTIKVSETGASGADLANYHLALDCVDNLDPAATITATWDNATSSWSFVQPTALKGSDVVCTIHNVAPLPTDDSSTGNVIGSPVTVDVLGNDGGKNLDPASVQIVGTANPGDPLTVPGEGTWSVDTATGKITFTPLADFTGNPSPISYTVKDVNGTESRATTITVAYKPLAGSDSSSGNAIGDPVTVEVIGSGMGDGLDPASVRIVGTANPGDSLTVPGEGTWSVDTSTGKITFSPLPGFTGNPSPITYTLKDKYGAESNPATITITYRPASPPPVDPPPPPADPAPPASPTSNPTGTATVSYVDGNGATVAPSVVKTGTVGDSYSTAPAIVAGYKLTKAPDNASGTFTAAPQTVTYVYEKLPAAQGRVTVRYQDSDGRALTAPTTLTGDIGKLYIARAAAIPGYQPVTTPSNATGKYAVAAQTVTYQYEKIAAPPVIAAKDVSSRGNAPGGAASVSIPTSGSGAVPGTLRIVDPATGRLVTRLEVPDEGIWVLGVHESITFTPEGGFGGDPTPVTYEVMGAHGEQARGLVTVTYARPLAYTGVDVVRALECASALLIIGAGFLRIGRRRVRRGPA